MREIDNEAKITKKAEMKRKFNRNQKRITPCDIQLSCVRSLLKVKNNIVEQGETLYTDGNIDDKIVDD